MGTEIKIEPIFTVMKTVLSFQPKFPSKFSLPLQSSLFTAIKT